MQKSVQVRDVDPDKDAAGLRAIYSHYVLHSSATFEEVPPTVSGFRDLIHGSLERQLPFLVAEINGSLVGYASAKPFYGRSGFFPSVENSVYIAAERLGQGIGTVLLAELITRCERLGLLNMIALIGGGDSNIGSTKLHEKFGFARVGQIKNCGRKVGEYHSMSIYQLALWNTAD